MKTFKLFILIALVPMLFINQKAMAEVKTDLGDLDQLILKIKKNKNSNPFSVGEENALKNPAYLDIVQLAQELNADIEWVDSVSKSVRELDYVSVRMKVKASDEFDGWFDEFTTPNLILIHNKASLATVMHEMRHAFHLGVHPPIKGFWFDEYLYKTKNQIKKFQQKIDDDGSISASLKTKLNKCATRALETASEISAHSYDVELAIAFKSPFLESFQGFIKDYLNEHKRDQICLQKVENKFALELEKKLTQFMLERGI